MFNSPSPAMVQRLDHLKNHLKAENPALLEVVPTYCQLDRILYKMGLMSTEESLATRISWWPLVSILGTFSSGKSTFINGLVGERLQLTGNQAVDDKFTVVCYGTDGDNRTLPGSALDADPRFPFYRMSQEIESVMAGEGKRIDHYLQLKATGGESNKGRILIDSPGFDADDQRRSTLKITNHIIDLSDLVLIFFDARHPEPGAMQDTLQHLVAGTVKRADAGKFLYVLNQIDSTAKEDNPEAVVAAWQRAISQAGLSTGRFYTIYDEEAALPIEDLAVKERFETKRDVDKAAINKRIGDVEVERNYRIVGHLETICKELEGQVVPYMSRALARWRKRVMWMDALGLILLAAAALGVVIQLPDLFGQFWTWLWGEGAMVNLGVTVGGLVAVMLAWHFWMRKLAAKAVVRSIPAEAGHVDIHLSLNLRSAFLKSTGWVHSIFQKTPAGWGGGTRRKLKQIREAADRHIQKLNDTYTDPSGRGNGAPDPAGRVEPAPLNTVPAGNDEPVVLAGAPGEPAAASVIPQAGGEKA